MPKPKASLTAALAQKPAPAAAELAPASALAPAAKPPKVDDGSITTSLKVQRQLLADLKSLAVLRRCSVNDVIVEAIENHLALNGRRSAA
jgi:hypothetical protein